MQQQEFGPDRRALRTMVLEEIGRCRQNAAEAAVVVCDCLTNRRKYKEKLEHFQLLDSRYNSMWARWDQLKQGGES